MATFKDLLKRVADPTLRSQLEEEYKRVLKNKKFGLVFEEHRPEFTALYGVAIKPGMSAAVNGLKNADVLDVLSIDGRIAKCHNATQGTIVEYPVTDLVAVARFEDPIFPVLAPIDEVENDPGNPLWHTLIQSDNYHALQLLEYMYRGKVDCIYIDPPYNSGARDWKYNNDYVDEADMWRHSKWLSMMEKRLRLAAKLLNPKDSVMIVSIDEKEYLRLGMLLEQIFPEARIQMVSTIIKPEGTQRTNEFSRTNEYLYFVMFGDVKIAPWYSSMFWENGEGRADGKLDWRNLRRRENTSVRAARPNQFYPIYVNKKSGAIDSIGEALAINVDRNSVPVPDGCYPVYPLSPNGTEMLWSKHYKTARKMLKEGYIMAVNGRDEAKVGIKYLAEGTVADIDSGKIVITGRGEHNEVVGSYGELGKLIMPKSVWNMASHNAQTGGSLLIKSVIGDNRFPFPKSLYAVHDTLRFFVANKPNARILDFFAGSGTTLHAVNLLNAEDGGMRQCIMVTNNEVREDEAKDLKERGFKPGDEEWESLGIAKYVAWPRTVCSIEGHNVNGDPLEGNYGVEVDDFVVDEESAIVSKVTGKPIKKTIYKKTSRQMYPALAEMAMSDGFKANAKFFKLDFVDKDSVRLGKQFKGILPILWMRSGAKGKCPVWNKTGEPDIFVKPENGFAILVKYDKYSEFIATVNADPNIVDVYFVTNSESDYREMCTGLKRGKKPTHLYHSYLENFVIGCRRNGK